MLSLLSFVPGIGVIAQVASAVFSFLISCRPCLIVLAMLACWVWGDVHGTRHETAVCTAANYALALAAQKRQTDIATSTATEAAARADQLEVANKALADQVAKIPSSAACRRINAGDLKRLEGIK